MYVNPMILIPCVVREPNAAIQYLRLTGAPSLTFISVYPFGETIRTRNESHFRPLALQEGRKLGMDHGSKAGWR